MRFSGRLWAQRRFVLLCVGIWLAAELAGAPSPYPERLAYALVGLALTVMVAAFLQGLRFHFLSLVLALLPLRFLEEPARAAAALRYPALSETEFLAGGIVALILLSRIIVFAGWCLDRFRLAQPWFTEASAIVGRPRSEVWRSLCTPDIGAHWDPRVRRIARGQGGRCDVEIDAGRGRTIRLALHEVDAEEGVFLELRTEPNPAFSHGLAPVLSVLLEEGDGTTLVTIGVELPRPRLLRLARYWLDGAELAYLWDFLAVMDARPGGLLPSRRLAGQLAA
ncbi:MAG TPA: hypothetical protein VFR34_04295 [Paracoccaceae bacterium]|nr:hypothetical protein [Paracoccaceae bacterium]